MRAEDHLGEDAKGDETEEASHGATEECSGRHEVPVKSHVTKCLHEPPLHVQYFSIFFFRCLRHDKVFSPCISICLNPLWYNEGVCLRYSLPLPHCQKGFRVSGPARPFLRCISPRKHE